MGYEKPRVRLGDSAESTLPPNILDVIVALVVATREAGSLYYELTHLREQLVEADERAAAIRADLQRFGRQAEIGLRATAAESSWPQVREHGIEAVAALHLQIKRWQDFYASGINREKQKLESVAASVGRDLRGVVATFMQARAPEFSERSLRRRWLDGRYHDVVKFDPYAGVKLELDAVAEQLAGSAPARVRRLAPHVELIVGMKKAFLRGLRPNVIKLDDLFILELEVTRTGASLTLCRKQNGLGERIVLELGLDRGVVTGTATLDGGHPQPVATESRSALSGLWRALNAETTAVASRPCKLRSFTFDGEPTKDPEEVFKGFERALAYYGPIIRQIVEHTEHPDELVVKLERDEGPSEELYVLRADLAQHLLALPPVMQKRLAPRELMGNAAVMLESDLIDLGVIVQPDAGDDSSVIALHDVAAPAMSDSIDNAFQELVSDDIIIVDGHSGDANEEVSGCYDLDQLMSTPRGVRATAR